MHTLKAKCFYTERNTTKAVFAEGIVFGGGNSFMLTFGFPEFSDNTIHMINK
jgi:hypothetical protein